MRLKLNTVIFIGLLIGLQVGYGIISAAPASAGTPAHEPDAPIPVVTRDRPVWPSSLPLNTSQLITTTGVYSCASCSQAHPWYVTETHFLYWDEQPFVPYGFWNLREVRGENLSVSLINALTDQNITNFKVALNFSDYSGVSKQEHIDLVNQETDYIIQRGGTYAILVEDILTQTEQTLTYVFVAQNGEVTETQVSPTLIPGFNLPLMHRSAIRDLYRNDFLLYQSAVSKEGLRAITLFNEPMGINISFSPSDLSDGSGVGGYPDLTPDAEAMSLYRAWLAQQYGTIESLNNFFGSQYTDFNQVPWFTPASSFSVIDESAVETVQNQFWVYLMGSSYGAIADIAREVFGDVPILVGGTDELAYFSVNPLQKAAIENGLDGLMISFYGNEVSPQVPGTFIGHWGTGKETMATLQTSTDKTLLYWIQEGNRVLLDPSDSGEFIRGISSCSQMRGFMTLLTDLGFTSFLLNKELIGQGAILASAPELKWFADLKPFIVDRVVNNGAVPAAVCPMQEAWLPLIITQ